MSLKKNKENDNFYPVSIPEVGWNCDYLWSTNRGCPFNCNYCSSKRLNKRFKVMGDPTAPKRLKGEWTLFPNSDNECLKRFILPNAGVFISPYNDIMSIPEEDIRSILYKIYDSSEYWFDRDSIGHNEKSQFKVIMQTKKPQKYFHYFDLIPQGSWLGTTIETDDDQLYHYLNISKAPHLVGRKVTMEQINKKNFKTFVTIEPIMKFTKMLIWWMQEIKPDLIFIGCDTGKNNLPEPSRNELIELIEQLKKITTVHVKKNAQCILSDLLI